MKLAFQLLWWIAGLGAAFVLLLGGVVDRFGVQDHARPADAIVVLGARVDPGGVASAVLRARVDRALQLYRSGLASTVVFSGGLGDHAPTEAEAARDYAIARGLPSRAALVETESHSTRENAELTAALLRERGLRTIVVVSDPYHLLRARQNFRVAGFEAWTSPAPEAPRHRDAIERIVWTLREVAALVRTPRLLLEGPRDDLQATSGRDVNRGSIRWSSGSVHGKDHQPRDRAAHRVLHLAHGRRARARSAAVGHPRVLLPDHHDHRPAGDRPEEVGG